MKLRRVCFESEATSGSRLRLQRPRQRLNICSCFALEVEPGADWKSLPLLLPGHVMTYFSVLCTVYSPPLRCFIWTFLTGIALNYARRGAFWPSLKMKYLLVFSLAESDCSHPETPELGARSGTNSLRGVSVGILRFLTLNLTVFVLIDGTLFCSRSAL